MVSRTKQKTRKQPLELLVDNGSLCRLIMLDFFQAYSINAFWDTDEHVRFWVQKEKFQSRGKIN